jgi:hypothetical protein
VSDWIMNCQRILRLTIYEWLMPQKLYTLPKMTNRPDKCKLGRGSKTG